MSNPIRGRLFGQSQAAAARIKAEAVRDRFLDAKGQDQSLTVGSRAGEVVLFHVEFTEIEDSTCVDIWTTGQTDQPPQFRIFNPPTLARDPQGDIEVAGVMYREDPLAAIAEVILGGRRK